jgi:hypothetical protein
VVSVESTQSANIAEGSPHHVSSLVHASMVSVESDSIITLLQPRQFASDNPSFIAIALDTAGDAI